MRVLIGSESFYPNISGVAITTHNLATYLAQKGHEVVVAAPSPNRYTYWDNRNGVKIYYIGSIINPFRKDLRLTTYPRRKIRRLIDSWQPEVVHLQDPTSICLNLFWTARQRKIPIIMSNHFELDFVLSYLEFLKPVHPFLRKGMNAAFSLLYNSCQHIVCPSETLKQELLVAGIESPISAVSNGVDLQRFNTEQKQPAIFDQFSLPAVPIVLYVGRIDPDKSINTLLEAIPLVLVENQAHFVLCGGGKLVPECKQEIDQRGLSRNVSFIGPFDYQSDILPQLYNAACCFTIPSKIETQSMVTLEAMASGLAVVGANGGALPELIEDGVNGYLFEPDNADDLARKLGRLIQNQSLRDTMGRNSTVKAALHEINGCFEIIEQIYTEAIECCQPDYSRLD